jgi:hypothetical protein
MNDNPIDDQMSGKQLDYQRDLTFTSAQDATLHFHKIKTKLLQINHWHSVSNGPSAQFVLMDEKGHSIDRTVQQSDFIRIDIPGPGLPSSHGYDWVLIERIEEEEEENARRLTLTLRPAADPTQSTEDTAHFFKALATSNVVLHQQAHTLIIRYAGRNELINTDNASLIAHLRNWMVGLTAKLGASYLQWKALIDGLADTKEAD